MSSEFLPPKSPIPLLQELYFPDKWKVFVICIMLNCTQRKQVDQIIEQFFEKFPTPEKLLEESDETIAECIKSLGFKNRRTKRLRQFSKDFLEKNWSDPRELSGIGSYAASCYEMLFLGKFGSSPPNDHALKSYWNFYTEQFSQK